MDHVEGMSDNASNTSHERQLPGDPVYRFVGNRLKHYRRAKGLRQAELAKEAGVSTQQYQKYEDASSRCSLANLIKLAAYLNIPLGLLLPPDGQSGPLSRPGMAEAPAKSLEPPPRDTEPKEAQGQVSRLIVAFLAIEDGDARAHLLGLAERLRAQSAV